jgi:transcriptional regulator with XRE-family HTH domain
MITFGARLKKVRRVLGLDQKAFGETIGVAGRDTISRWERGLGFPSADILGTMRQKYRINIDWLISGEGAAFIEGETHEKELISPSVLVTDPVEYLLSEEEVRAGINLTPEQRTAILKILRELVSRDVRSIQELLCAMPEGKKPGKKS